MISLLMAIGKVFGMGQVESHGLTSDGITKGTKNLNEAAIRDNGQYRGICQLRNALLSNWR